MSAPTGDPLDFTEKYNTPLPPERSSEYQRWASSVGQDPAKGRYDYDLQGAFLANSKASGNGHLTDEFKKPNHPTFSDQSKYHGIDGYTGGSWVQGGGDKWAYQPSQTNLGFRPDPQLQQYFNKVEPGNSLLPAIAAPTASPSRGLSVTDLSNYGDAMDKQKSSYGRYRR